MHWLLIIKSNTADVAIGDFNHDGKTDIVNTNFGSATVSVLLGRGDSTFRSIIFYNDITVGDFNHNGKLDIAHTN